MAKTIVVIDDDSDDIDIMGSFLKKVDPDVKYVPFTSPVGAIKRLYTDEFLIPDYIFIDINMPLMSGSECLVKLRGTKKFKNIPIIILSTSIIDEIADNLKKCGATFIFEKPNYLDGYLDILKYIGYIKSF